MQIAAICSAPSLISWAGRLSGPAALETFIDLKTVAISFSSIVLNLNALHFGLIYGEIDFPLKNCQVLLFNKGASL